MLRAYIINFFHSLGGNSIRTIFPAYLSEFTPDAFLISIVNSAYVIARLLAFLLSGISDAIGERKSVLISSVALASLFLCYIVADSLLALFLISALIGVFSTIFYAGLSIVLSRSKQRGIAFTSMESFFQIGFVVGSITGGLVADYYSMKFVFLIAAITAIITAFIATGFKRNYQKKAPVIHNLRESVSSHLKIYICSGAFTGILNGIIYLTIPLLILTLGYSKFHIGVVIAFSSVVTAVLIPTFGKLSESKGQKTILVFATVLGIFASILLVFYHSLMFIIILAPVLVLARNANLNIGRAWLINEINKRPATHLGINDSFFSAGTIIGGITAGAIIEFSGYSMVFLFMFAVLVIQAILFMFYAKNNKLYYDVR